MKSISDFRKEYTKSTLDISTAERDPVVQFTRWFNEAVTAGLPEPNAMNLATISEQGTPSSRIVLLKGIESGKLLFYTNYQSQKGKALWHNPACALNFFWPELERQVRINGTAEQTDEATSVAYFQQRPRASQLGAWASPQSSVIASREILETRMTEIEKRFAGADKLPKPKQWGGYAVTPLEFEFWQGRPNRLHDRILYTKDNTGWTMNRLAP
jgi:pyridoxamine 5'-phosphate oxidase